MKGVDTLLKSILIYIAIAMIAFACICMYTVVQIAMGVTDPMLFREPTVEESKVFFIIFLFPVSIFIMWAGVLGIIDVIKTYKK